MNSNLKMLYYFAYGSNLHPLRLKQRVPSARLVGVVKHSRYSLCFHKKSIDGSVKCNLLNTGNASDFIYGAIYTIKAEHKKDLDKFEGKGFGYEDKQIQLQYGGREYTCFTYLAQSSYIVDELKPYHWYKQLVILGARYLQFPELYISAIETVESIEDLNVDRKKENMILIESMIQYRA